MSEHFFDQAVALQPDGEHAFRGAAHPAWANMVGPFGGITAASALNGVLSHPKLLGAPIALTVNYAAALGPGDYRLAAVPVRTNRSTQHWTLAMTQPGADGGEDTVLTATAVTAARRETWGLSDAPMPTAPAPHTLDRFKPFGAEWLKRYDMRTVHGAVPATWDGSGEHSLTQLWVRDEPGRPLDFLSLASLADVFYPRVWLRRATRVPAGTVSITTYFHADAAMLARSGTGYLFGQARGQAFSNGFFDQTAQLWNEGGELLATSHQIVYYKE
ncbi:thioesterase family protein [Pseudorhodoferax sp. LjRoot39]|uniref:acyl-CoA thioesterase n=1 Tax=Pseudorhodoferax sp. LjRoot39 TaxID=3342328 RepID=UPI003ECC4E59